MGSDYSQISPEPPSWAGAKLFMCFKDLLTILGRFTPQGWIYALDAVINYIAVGQWMRVKGFRTKKYKSRSDLFLAIAAELQDEKILYLEFGVFKGDTMREWCRLLQDKPLAKLHGFDSFTGLPEHWNHFNYKGKFSTDGQVPNLTDSRVEFFKGWFSQSLLSYRIPDHDCMVINLDCDLYSSAMFVLTHLSSEIKVGDIIYFDEFYDRHHELKAFDDFINENPAMKFECVGQTLALANCAFRRVS